MDVIEDSTGITLRADLPGVPKDKLKLQVEAGTLTIEGEVSFAMPENMEATYAEIEVPRFRRVFTLSKELDTGKVSAEFKHGVLSLRIPKAEHAQPRRIDMEIAVFGTSSMPANHPSPTCCRRHASSSVTTI